MSCHILQFIHSIQRSFIPVLFCLSVTSMHSDIVDSSLSLCSYSLCHTYLLYRLIDLPSVIFKWICQKKNVEKHPAGSPHRVCMLNNNSSSNNTVDFNVRFGFRRRHRGRG